MKIRDGWLELLTSYGREIDSAPVDSVQAGKPWFAARDRARATVNGTRYVLTLGGAGASAADAEGAGGHGRWTASWRPCAPRTTAAPRAEGQELRRRLREPTLDSYRQHH
ncbi:hypothetical protein GCM10020000_70120 [Streptomyces olivoverticillatus]